MIQPLISIHRCLSMFSPIHEVYLTINLFNSSKKEKKKKEKEKREQ
jgi:hypothetical protein